VKVFSERSENDCSLLKFGNDVVVIGVEPLRHFHRDQIQTIFLIPRVPSQNTDPVRSTSGFSAEHETASE
jgi:hypothetical protein